MPSWLTATIQRAGRFFSRTGGGFFLTSVSASAGDGVAPALPNASPSRVREPLPTLSVQLAGPRIESRVSGGSTDGSIVTTFVAFWRPNPLPPEEWIELLRSAPFGTTTTSARELRWDGKDFSIERVNASEIEAFAGKIGEWVEYANGELAQRRSTPEAMARFAAQRRATELQGRFRR